MVLKTYTYQEFLPIVRALRALTRNEHTHVDKLGSVLEMWQTWPLVWCSNPWTRRSKVLRSSATHAFGPHVGADFVPLAAARQKRSVRWRNR